MIVIKPSLPKGPILNFQKSHHPRAAVREASSSQAQPSSSHVHHKSGGGGGDDHYEVLRIHLRRNLKPRHISEEDTVGEQRRKLIDSSYGEAPFSFEGGDHTGYALSGGEEESYGSKEARRILNCEHAKNTVY
uniref:Uncharacterized protein n=1 Tax=Heliothis virescens TaxID=7102 RepID=A0A2A4JVP9_HELVI